MGECVICGAPTTDTVTTATIPNHIEREVFICEGCKEIISDGLDDLD